MSFQDKKIVIYVTGGIAVYKAAELVRLFIKDGAQVIVAMTESATKFVTPLTFQILTKHDVYLDSFDEKDPEKINHIHLADWADLAIVVPATANTIGKLANGIADNLVTSALIATNVTRVVVPAMNEKMLYNPASQRNLQQLEKDGYHIIEPEEGFLAEGYSGKGRLPDIHSMFTQVAQIYAQATLPQVLKGKSILITAGGTREKLDPVRYLTNESSGKMGYALAKMASHLGAQVHLVSTKKELAVPIGVSPTYVADAKEMAQVVTDAFPEQDVVIMAAAVADFRFKEVHDKKIKKKDNDQEGLTLELERNPDILASLGKQKSVKQFLVGFAAETNDVKQYALKKLEKKKADLIIANDVSDQTIGFNSSDNEVTLYFKDGAIKHLEKADKETIAQEILQEIAKHLD